MTTLAEKLAVDASASAKGSDRSKTRRVQIEMPPRSMDRLEALKEVTEAASYAEVVKNSLRLYEAMILEVEEGSEVYIQRKGDDKPVPYKIFV